MGAADRQHAHSLICDRCGRIPSHHGVAETPHAARALGKVGSASAHALGNRSTCARRRAAGGHTARRPASWLPDVDDLRPPLVRRRARPRASRDHATVLPWSTPPPTFLGLAAALRRRRRDAAAYRGGSRYDHVNFFNALYRAAAAAVAAHFILLHHHSRRLRQRRRARRRRRPGPHRASPAQTRAKFSASSFSSSRPINPQPQLPMRISRPSRRPDGDHSALRQYFSAQKQATPAFIQ